VTQKQITCYSAFCLYSEFQSEKTLSCHSRIPESMYHGFLYSTCASQRWMMGNGNDGNLTILNTNTLTAIGSWSWIALIRCLHWRMDGHARNFELRETNGSSSKHRTQTCHPGARACRDFSQVGENQRSTFSLFFYKQHAVAANQRKSHELSLNIWPTMFKPVNSRKVGWDSHQRRKAHALCVSLLRETYIRRFESPNISATRVKLTKYATLSRTGTCGWPTAQSYMNIQKIYWQKCF